MHGQYNFYRMIARAFPRSPSSLALSLRIGAIENALSCEIKLMVHTSIA